MRTTPIFVIVLISALGGCTYERVVRDGWAPLRALADKPATTSIQKRSTQDASSTYWTLLLESFSGPSRHGHAISLIRDIRSHEANLDLWVQEAGQVVYVYSGRYGNPQSSQAQKALNHTRKLKIEGQTRFASAQFTPVTVLPQDTPAENPLDLRRFQGMYTLQIGFYDDAFGSKFRKAAEEAAEVLREDGAEAYFYHGPHRSLVTVGLFSNDDFVQQGVQRVYGPTIRSLQQKFPNNLGNGVTLVEKVNGQVKGNQPSFLVRVF